MVFQAACGENTKRRTTIVFAKAGLDNVTSTMCKHQQLFRQKGFN